MSKQVRFYETGDANVLKVEEIADQIPSTGEVRIKVDAIGINRADIMFREGQYLQFPQFPAKIGYDAAGTIEALGPDVTEFSIGQKVSTFPGFSMSEYGVYGETAIVPVNALSTYPSNLTPLQGAAIWMPNLTVWGALIDYAGLTPLHSVLITAASSSVGVAAIQIAKLVGAMVIATTRHASKKAELLANGADHVVVTDEQDMAEQVMKITDNKGADVIFDPIAGSMLETLSDCAAQFAKIIIYGALNSEPTVLPLMSGFKKGLSVRVYTVFEVIFHPEKLVQAKKFVYQGLESGALRPVLDRTFKLDEIVKAHQYMESNQHTGKIMVVTD